MNKFINYVKSHKIRASLAVIGLVVVGYFAFFRTSSAEVQYIVGPVEKGTLVISVSGSGQISSSDQVDVKPKVSGELVYLPVIEGQEVRIGQLLAQIDARNAQQAVRDAQISLESAQLSLSKLGLNQQSGASDLDQSIKDAQLALDQAYQNGFNAVSTTFLDLPSILSGTEDVFLQNNLEPGNSNVNAYGNMVSRDTKAEVQGMVNNIIQEYNTVKAQYQRNFDNYKNTSRSSEPTVTEALLKETLATVEAMDDLTKHEQNMLDTVVLDLRTNDSRSVPSIITNYQSNIGQYLNTLNSSVTNLTNISNSFDTKRQAIIKAEQSLNITNQSDPLDVATQENVIKQRQAALISAQNNLANYYVRAPFSGRIAVLDAKRGDSVSGSTVVATLISPKQIAEISLNEIDVTKVGVGQKATFTFDAIPDLTLTGKVVSVDIIGTVAQNVVSYKVKIALDTQDGRVKPGMSVSLAIITQVKQDVLMVPNGAVKSQGAGSTVQTVVLPTESSQTATITATQAIPSLKSVPVEVGLSNDTMTEITSGLNEGDSVVTRTISATAAKAAAPTTRTGAGAGVRF